MTMDEKVILAIFIGCFSLLGSALGAFFSRRSEYEKWHRQNKGEVFARFLEFMSKAREKTTILLYDLSLEKLQRDIRVTEAYTPALDYIRVVRLYISAKQRDRFEKLAKEIWSLHSSESLGQCRLKTMNEKLDYIQSIFEQELHL